MNRRMLLLVTALIFLLARGETPLVADSDGTLSSLTRPGESHVAQTIIDAKPSLRALKSTSDARGEEERDISGIAKKVASWAGKSNLVKNIVQKRMQVKAQQRVKLIKKLAAKNYNNLDVIYRKKITPDEYFEAMGFPYWLRFARKAQIDEAAQRISGLRKWDDYEKLYYKLQPRPS